MRHKTVVCPNRSTRVCSVLVLLIKQIDWLFIWILLWITTVLRSIQLQNKQTSLTSSNRLFWGQIVDCWVTQIEGQASLKLTLLHCKHNNTKPRLRNGWEKRQQFLYDHDLSYSSVLTDTVGDLSLWVVQQLAVCKSLVKTWQCEQYASLYEMRDWIYLRHLFEGTMGIYSLLYAIQLNAWQFHMCFVQMRMLKFSCSISLRVV